MGDGLNTVVLYGNLGSNPELRQVGDTQVCELRMATTESWLNREGKREEHTEWHNVEAWGGQAAACAKVLSKGWTLTVQGSIRTESYEKDGQKRQKTKIRAHKVIFGSAPGGRSSDESDSQRPDDRGRDDRRSDDRGDNRGAQNGGRRDERPRGNGNNGGRRDERGNGGRRDSDPYS